MEDKTRCHENGSVTKYTIRDSTYACLLQYYINTNILMLPLRYGGSERQNFNLETKLKRTKIANRSFNENGTE